MIENRKVFMELLFEMTRKELRTRYKYTFFGFLWLVANPVIQMLVIGFVFTYFMKEPVEQYYYFLFIGLLIWNYFSQSLTKATPSLVFERALIKKASSPNEVIVLSIILSNGIHFLTALLICLIITIAFGTFDMSKSLYLLLGVTLLGIFTTGISLLTSALNVRYRDTNFFVQALLIPWFYITPVIYSLTYIPSKLLWIWHLNPLTGIIQLIQYPLLNTLLPGIPSLLTGCLVILIITILGMVVFKKQSVYFDDWL